MKIEVLNNTTGEITQVEAGATVGQIVGVSNMNEEEMSDAIAANIKGLSPAKVSEVLKMIIDTDLPFFNAIDAIRNGDTKRFRLVIEEVGRKPAFETKVGGTFKGHAGAVGDSGVEVFVAAGAPEDSADTELTHTPLSSKQVETVETADEPTTQAEADDDAEYQKLYEEAKVLVAANDVINPAELKKKFAIDKETADRMWSDMQSEGMFDPAPPEDQEDETKVEASEEEQPAAASSDPDPEFADNEDEAAKVRGQKALLRGAGPDENPYDGGTPDHVEWMKNYNHAKKSMDAFRQEGAESAMVGGKLADCPHEIGSVQFKGWKEGFDAVNSEPAAETTKSTDSHQDGKDAALNGGKIEDNPHAAGMTKHRIWNDGFKDGQAELAAG